MGREMYIRFATPRVHRYSGRETGVFMAAYWLKYSGRLTEDEVELLDELLSPYGDLKVPPIYRDDSLLEKRRDAAICWFKTQSRKMISQMYGVVGFLKYHGMPMALVRTELPGRVLYEDEHQVAAVPFRRARHFKCWI
jgi:hypothetical protein